MCDSRAGGDVQGDLPVVGFLPRSQRLVARDLQPREVPVTNRTLWEGFEFAGDIVGEPADCATGIGHLAVPALEGFARQNGAERRERLVTGSRLVERCRLDTEVPPAGLSAGRFEIGPAGPIAGAPVCEKRVRYGDPGLDGDTRTCWCLACDRLELRWSGDTLRFHVNTQEKTA